jgi:pyruvate/2-oxoglutarate/acetoin dehydrogenase E1 component
VLCPLDWATVAESVTKTSRCLIVHEDYAEFGVAAELAARISGELFEHLDAPVARLGAAFHPIPFSPPLEQATLPQSQNIVDAIADLARY